MFLIIQHILNHYIFNFILNQSILTFSFHLISYKFIIVFVYLYYYEIKLVFLIMLILIMIKYLLFCYVMHIIMINEEDMIMDLNRILCWKKCSEIVKIIMKIMGVSGSESFCLNLIIILIKVIRFLILMCHRIILNLNCLKIMSLFFIHAFYCPKT